MLLDKIETLETRLKYAQDFAREYKIPLWNFTDNASLKKFLDIEDLRKKWISQIPLLIQNLKCFTDFSFYNRLVSLEEILKEMSDIKQEIKKIITKLNEDLKNIQKALDNKDYIKILTSVSECLYNLFTNLSSLWGDLEKKYPRVDSIKNAICNISACLIATTTPIIQIICTINSAFALIAKSPESKIPEAIFDSVNKKKEELVKKTPEIETLTKSYQDILEKIPLISNIADLKIDKSKINDFAGALNKNEKAAPLLGDLFKLQSNLKDSSTYPDSLKNIIKLSSDSKDVLDKIQKINLSEDSSIFKIYKIYEVATSVYNRDQGNLGKEDFKKNLDNFRSLFMNQILLPLSKESKTISQAIGFTNAIATRINSLFHSNSVVRSL